VPYEKERLRQEIENYESRISRQIALTMNKAVNLANGDQLLRHLKFKQHRLKKILDKIKKLEENINMKIKMELELQEQELSNQQNLLLQEQDSMMLTSEQQELLDECTKLQQQISGADQEANKPEFSCFFDMLQYKKQKVHEA
jgi:hypothetical protein